MKDKKHQKAKKKKKMPKTQKVAQRSLPTKGGFAPATAQTKTIVVNGKKMTVSAASGSNGAPRMKGKVERKGAAAEVKKLEAVQKSLKAQQLAQINECEMIQKKDGQYKITTWKTPKLMTINDGGVFFISGANKAQEMTEEEFNKQAEESFKEMTKNFKQPEEKENIEENVEENKEAKEEPEEKQE